MKLPSIRYLADQARGSLRRFPWVLAMAFAATGLAIWYLDRTLTSRVGHFTMAAYLGISLNFGLSMLLERMRPSHPLRHALFPAAMALLFLYAHSLQGQTEYLANGRYALLLLASHLFVAVAPFPGGGYTRGFWEYNHRLFLRIIASGIFSAFLFLGLAGALAAVKLLFGIPLPDTLFLWTWLGVSGVFNTWFFLAGVPADLENLERPHPYPGPLKILAQYILVPLVSLYLAILYAYAAKIVLQWEWPIGWVSYLVLACALLGILTLLLIHPIQELEENRWIQAFSRYFFLALLPLVVLLFAAIGKRISEYRLTENRYFVLAMAVWLAGIALYFTFSKARNIKRVPQSLGLLALLASFGPWGAFQVSWNSQASRLQDLLETHGLLVDGRIVALSSALDRETEAVIGSVVDYLERRDQLGRARPWLPDSAQPRADAILRDKKAFLKLMGLEYVHLDRHGKALPLRHDSFVARKESPRRITGFDYSQDFERHIQKELSVLVVPDPDRIEAHYLPEKGRIRFTTRGDFLVDIDLHPLLDSLRKTYPKGPRNQIPPELMYLEAESQGYRVAILVHYLSAAANKAAIESLTGTLYVGVRGLR